MFIESRVKSYDFLTGKTTKWQQNSFHPKRADVHMYFQRRKFCVEKTTLLVEFLRGSRWNFFFFNCVGWNHVGTVSRDVRVCTVKFVWVFFLSENSAALLSTSLSSRDFQAGNFLSKRTAEIVDIDAARHSVPKVGQFPRRRLFSSLIVRRMLSDGHDERCT